MKLDLLDKVRQKEDAGYQRDNTIPTFVSTTQKKYKDKKKFKRKILIITGSIVLSISLLISSIYIPQFFIKSEGPQNNLISTPNAGAISIRADYLSAHPNDDFDNDGVSNLSESQNGSDPYKYDSDGDGVNDSIDTTPTKYGKDIAESLSMEGIFKKSPYEMNGIIMWADDESSLIKGGVILLANGNYRFSNFKGWATFPSGKYAYAVENNTHALLKHKAKENAWYINGDMEVEVVNKEPEYIHKFSIFGSSSYCNDNGFFNFLSNLLPDKGWISSQKIWLDDTFINNDSIVFATNFNTPAEFSDSRFGHIDYKLSNLTMVYNTIKNGDSVYASLFDKEQGECILRIIGFDSNGDLIAENLEATTANYIYIFPTAAKTLTKDNSVVIREWFEFTGCGYNSYDGAVISFFASSSESNSYTSEQTNPDTIPDTPTPDEVPIDPEFPENGEVKIGDVTVYYIDGNAVSNTFIRKNKGVFEKCKITDKGAFYVDETGLKKTGKFKIKDNIYYYNDRFFINEFVQCESKEYFPGSQSSYNTIYVDSNGKQVFGWFSYGGNNIYASQNSGYIAHNCFVRNQYGSIRYVGSYGTVVTNKLIEIDGIEIMIDENGSIINENYAINVINNNLVY